jgi:hypothetical protein
MKIAIAFLIFLSITNVFGQVTINIGSGFAFQTYNDVRIPNETGTTFSFTDDFEIQVPVFPFRLKAAYTIAERNHIIALFAPLSIFYEGNAPFDIQFQQTLFQQGEFIRGFYKFNSYRLTYRRDFIRNERFLLGAGFTAKIRDATVRLQSDNQSGQKDDLGFVPLINLLVAYKFDSWTLFLKGDGLFGGPGRAFDYVIAAEIPFTDFLSAKAGFRIIEGGANVDEVYNFTLIGSAVAALVLRF